MKNKEKINSDEQDLNAINSIKKGNSKAFEILYKKYKDYLLWSMLRAVKSRDVAEDLTMEVLQKTYENIHKFKPDYTFNSWLTRIANNHLVDYIRKQNLKVEKNGVSIDQSFMLGINNDSPVSLDVSTDEVPHMESSDEARYLSNVLLLKACFSRLKEKDKEVMELLCFEDKPYAEIASMLGVGLNDVKVTIHRSKIKIKKWLGYVDMNDFAEANYDIIRKML